MNFRVGDILIWRSTNFWDVLGENTIRLTGFHTGIVLVGKSFRKISAYGPSPSNTYVTFLIDKVYPIEEVVGQIWYRPNGSSLHVIKRCSGPDISEEEMYNLWRKFKSLKKRSWYKTVHVSIAAYLKIGGVVPKPGFKGQRYHLCSSLIGYMFTRLGFMHSKAEINNLLPVDFYNVRFYQKVKYKRVDIFDKGTSSLKWLFLSMLIRLGVYEPEDFTNKNVDKILAKYDYSQDMKIR